MFAPPDRPLISVIVPVRNSLGCLRACLDSILARREQDYEVIVVDDASTDDTPRVALDMGTRLVQRDRRGGPAAARNDGANVARGEYLVFIDADVCVHE